MSILPTPMIRFSYLCTGSGEDDHRGQGACLRKKHYCEFLFYVERVCSALVYLTWIVSMSLSTMINAQACRGLHDLLMAYRATLIRSNPV